MLDLTEYRKRIDAIDNEILRLFEERMKISGEIAEFKISTGKPVMDAAREKEKLESLGGKAHGGFNRTAVQELFRQIMSISRKRQYQLLQESGKGEQLTCSFTEQLPLDKVRVVFQGVEGAYSYAAMRAYFDNDIESRHVKTWRDAMEEVAGGKADYAVLPIENSTAGIVADIYDLLMEYRLYIVGEQILRIRHVLLGLPEAGLDDIESVYSHPQGLAQCRQFLEEHPRWRVYSSANTAVAARKIREDNVRWRAAIASREAGEVYGLKVLAEDICPNEENSTRFIIVSAREIYQENASRVSICFELPHEQGSLYSMLSHMIYNGLNMTRIESRPIPGQNWEYRFFVDFEGSLKDGAVKNALTGIGREALNLRVLGSY